MPELTVGVDLGGTNIKVGLVTDRGEIVHRHRVTTESQRGPEAVAERICGACRDLLAAAGSAADSVRGVGVGSPGTIDIANGVVLFSPNLVGWHDIPLRGLIEDGLGMRCVIDNDANVAALAEQWVGVGQGAGSLVLLTLGTGIGGGIVLDGRIWHGGRGVAGEVGHMSIHPDGPVCGCGNRGCLEAYASATAMVRRMRETIAAGTPTVLAEHADELTAARIHAAAVAGDQAARENIEQTGRYLGLGVSNLMHILNPEAVAFSGGVTAAGEMLLDPVRREVRWRTLEASRRDVRISLSALPEDAGLIGAARCFMLA
ncbi:MAG: ROK family protein [Candidatus Brocadiaceae bacterium]|nr:ROK family protein [Candidatus Brocadiaceae bacterium]